MSFILFCVIMIFNLINDDSVIKSLFTGARYTYGPLLGIFAYGLFIIHKVIDKYVPSCCDFSSNLLFYKYLSKFRF